ncbi:MAG: holo-ACP synthase [Alphaproteobacteria bacterium]|nr:holo-ACP synthase [Alphaproteobacteria bacterium]
MILGIGTDMVDTRRISRLYARFGERLTEKLLSEAERAALRPGDTARQLAKRFAAKEATLKALGTGLAQGWRWHDMEITHDTAGKPLLLCPKAGQGVCFHLSLTDEPPYALAFVVMEQAHEATR